MSDTTPRQTAGQGMAPAVWGMLLTLGALWGASFFFARVAVAEINPIVLVFYRVALAAIALNLYVAVAGPPLRGALALAGRFAILAVFNNIIPFSLIFLGQTELGAGMASVLNATTPVWTLLIANVFIPDEKLSPHKIAGIGISLAGTAILMAPGLLAGLGGPLWAKFALIGAAMSYGIAAVLARRFFSGVAPPLVAAGQLTASSLIMLPVVLIAFRSQVFNTASTHVWLAVIALALASTAIGYILFFRIVAAAGATNASLVTLIVPVGAILLGAVFLGETVDLFEIAGIILIGSGLLIIDGRVLRRT